MNPFNWSCDTPGLQQQGWCKKSPFFSILPSPYSCAFVLMPGLGARRGEPCATTQDPNASPVFLLEVWHIESARINQLFNSRSLLTEVSQRWRTRAGAIRQHSLGRAGCSSSVLAPPWELELHQLHAVSLPGCSMLNLCLRKWGNHCLSSQIAVVSCHSSSRNTAGP